MFHIHHNNNLTPQTQTKKVKKHTFPINDHQDLLTEILQRLDGRSLGAAACVCKRWHSIIKNDALWEHLCFQQLAMRPSDGIRSVVLALGGYRRLYVVCVRPVVSRLKTKKSVDGIEVELALSLFCVEYYERLWGGGESLAKSLRFLCEPVNG